MRTEDARIRNVFVVTAGRPKSGALLTRKILAASVSVVINSCQTNRPRISALLMASFPLVWSYPRDILHCLTRERQTHDADNNANSTNYSLRCGPFTQ